MAYFDCVFGGGSSGGGYELTVTCDADFAGTIITATDGVTTLTQTCPSASPYEVVFEIPNGGDWTISGTISGDVYSTSINIPSSLELHYISTPKGSTVLPTDDIQTWLACANITDKSYTTLAEVLADRSTFETLIADSNACDYMARSTTWVDDVADDADAMALIGRYDYCSNALLGNATWAEAIVNSDYFEEVLNVKVPVMTSNTTPSGECGRSSAYSTNQEAWKVFDGDKTSNSYWESALNSITNEWVSYTFTKSVSVHKVMVLPLGGQYSPKNAKIQAYVNNEWVDAKSIVCTDSLTEQYFNIDANLSSNQWRILCIDNYGKTHVDIVELQFYGRASSNVSNTNGIIHTAMGNDSVYCVETGDTFTATDGIATVDFSQFDEGVYTFGSITAKNPTDLSQDYTKQFKITKSPYGGTTELYLMPKYTDIYWYGYNDNVKTCSAANGWSDNTGNNFSFVNPSYNTNDVTLNTSTSQDMGIYIDELLSNKTAHSICETTNISSSQGIYIGVSAKTVSRWSDFTIQNVANTIQHITKNGSGYALAFAYNNRKGKVYALWYE